MTRPRPPRRARLAAVPALALAAVVAVAQGPAGSDQPGHPGERHHIRVSDMPAPYATRSAANAPVVVPRPDHRMPQVPQGFKVEEFSRGLQQPRVIRVAPGGDVFVADSAAGEVHVYRMDEHGAVARQAVFAGGLDRPYGIAFYPPGDHPRYVYIANTGSVVRYPYRPGRLSPAGKRETIIPSLPTGGHWTRDLAFSPDGRTLFVAVGSASNAAEHELQGRPPPGFAGRNPPGAAWGRERWRADVLAFDPDGAGRRIYAAGLRNCAGMAVQPASGRLWCVVNERDGLGDNLPPDYATGVTRGAFYGWPWYYIGGHPDPRHRGERPGLADRVTVPAVLIQAHSAPLGIAFYDGAAFPPAYRGDAFVTLHGSWNRKPRTGYKVVRVLFKDGKATGAYEDFMTGFVLDDGHVWGRPVGVAVAADGSLLVSEDGNGTIWRISAAR